jgi:hypothetical protein
MMRTLNNLEKETRRKAHDRVKIILMEKKTDTIVYFLFFNIIWLAFVFISLQKQ